MLGILRGNKIKAERIAVSSRQCTPPVCQELACRAISCIIPHYSLNLTRLSNSRRSKESELALCLLPQSNPNPLMLCCNRAAHPHHLVFLLNPYCHLIPLWREQVHYTQQPIKHSVP